MSQGIPLATPYPWAPNETQISHPVSRKRKGSSLLVLNQALEDTSTSKRAKEILQNLLGDDLPKGTTNETCRLATVSLGKEPAQPLQTICPSSQLDDDKLLQMAREGCFSLLGSILRVIRESPSPVTTKHILRTCSLAMRPGDVPPQMDAKEMILAALHFLSSNHKSDYWELPLIRPTQEDNDLEKHSYEPVGSPTESQVQWLEIAFLKAPDNYLAREKYCPRLKQDEEGPLFLKGTLPTSATAKSVPTKRRSPASKQADTSSRVTLSTEIVTAVIDH